MPTSTHSLQDDAPAAWRDQTLVLELEALLDARCALMKELIVLDAQVANYFARLLPDSGSLPGPSDSA